MHFVCFFFILQLVPLPRTSRRLPAANTIHLRHITWQPALCPLLGQPPLGATPLRTPSSCASSRWMKTNCGPASPASVGILFRLTAHVPFAFFMCLPRLVASFFLCFFLFVNNNFLQYSESELQMHLQHQHSAIYLVDTTGS